MLTINNWNEYKAKTSMQYGRKAAHRATSILEGSQSIIILQLKVIIKVL